MITDSSRGAMAGLAVREPVESSPASGAGPADDIGLARTLPSEGVALQLGGAHEVAQTTERSTVVFCRYGKHGVAAQT